MDAKKHDVFKELTRTRQYFEKITKAETPAEPRPENATINKQAAIRFIRADLVGFFHTGFLATCSNTLTNPNHSPQADENNRELSNNLKELLAKERAKAVIRKRRAAEEASPSADTSDASGKSDSKAKRKKHSASKASK